MQKNTTGQKWIVFAYNTTTFLPVTGDAANITANLRIDGGAANPVDDTNPTELEGGYYAFDITQAESNGNLILIVPSSVTATVAVIGTPAAVYTTPASFNASVAQTGDSYGIVNNGTYGNSAIETLVDGLETAIGTAGAGLTALGDARIANLDATVSSRSSYAGGAVASVTAGVTVTTNNDKTGYALSSAGVDAILDDVVEGTLTLRQTMKIMLASLAGKSSGGGTATIIFKGVDGTTSRITATVDGNGNRTAITIDGA